MEVGVGVGDCATSDSAVPSALASCKSSPCAKSAEQTRAFTAIRSLLGNFMSVLASSNLLILKIASFQLSISIECLRPIIFDRVVPPLSAMSPELRQIWYLSGGTSGFWGIEEATLFPRSEFPEDIQLDGRESVGLNATKL